MPTKETGPFRYALAILMAMNNNPKYHIYEGTVPAAEIAKRRAKNRKARQARKANR